MILVLDDDTLVLDIVETILAAEGYRVVALQDPHLALELIGKEEPELIISDVMMPVMTGFEFRVTYQSEFPQRATPFAFLSSARDTDHVVQGLDLGVDDYLTKPVVPDIFKAKVRSLLARTRRQRGNMFRGDLSSFPFPRLLSFCERQGLSGELEVFAGDDAVRIRFAAGCLASPDGGEVDDVTIERLFDAHEGAFLLWSRPVDFSGLRGEGEAHAQVLPPSTPPGLLSTVQAGGKTFQIQTEYVPAPDNVGVTVVVLGGKTLIKQQTEKLQGLGMPAVIDEMERQHRSVEDAIRSKLERLEGDPQAREATLKATFDRLFDEGMTLYLERNFEGALETWEKAEQIDGHNDLLCLNLKMLRKRLADSPGP